MIPAGFPNSIDREREIEVVRLPLSASQKGKLKSAGYTSLSSISSDTEGNFEVERALQIAEACGDDMAEYSRLYHKGSQACEVKRQPKHFLENIFYSRVCSYTEQISLINYLDKFITEHKDVKVVIMDSIIFHFRQDFVDLALRVLGGMALRLMKLARKFDVAVILLNRTQMVHSI